MVINGRFWLEKDEKSFLGRGRVELLEKIDKYGSINAAAKAMGMSYKGAWERMKQINELADEPVIEKSTGGRGGGGSRLTPHARELIATFHRFDELHRQFIDRFAEAGDDPEKLARILARTFLTTSARNQLEGKIESIAQNALRGNVRIHIGDDDYLEADITCYSIEAMGLVEGCSAYSIIKSSDVIITDDGSLKNHGDNVLKGVVEKVSIIDDNSEIVLRLGCKKQIVGIGDLNAQLQEGRSAFAIISPAHVILGL